MKKIINNQVYDTETATLIEFTSWGNPSDFYFEEECLYRTQKGAWFMRGRGGLASRYAERISHSETIGGSKIWAMTEDEAMSWLAKVNVDQALARWPDKFQAA
mgnify:CR=1 FL=1